MSDKRHQTQEDRDLQALARHRHKSQPSQEDVGPGDTDHAELFGEEETTRPHQLIDRSQFADPEVRNAFQRDMDVAQNRYDSDPAYRAMWNMMRRQRKESNSSLQRVGSNVLAASAMPAQEIVNRITAAEEKLHRIDQSMIFSKWVLGILIPIVLGGIATIGYKMYSFGFAEGELEIRVLHNEKAIDKIFEQRHSMLAKPPGQTMANKE